MMQTNTEENYLKAIYLIGRKGRDKVSVTLLATSLGNNPASVIDMLKKLTDKELIEYDKTKGARLTGTGLKAALLTIRKHRLWELFLQKTLGYKWDEVHDIAEQLEHVHDENLADKLDEFLGFPEYDPHGEVIPKSNGQMPDINTQTLLEIETGKVCQVLSVKDTSKSFLQHLHRLNIGIGAILKVIEKIDFDGSLIILIDNSTQATISEKFAGSIYVN
jgi:DtxR family transcriptional regulator, Mn-dependent transcriptional regulator